MKSILMIALLVAAAGLVVSQPAPREQPGPLPGGGFLLNNRWTVKPAGEQIPVDTFPMSSVVSRDGKFLLVLNGGYKPPSISVIDLAAKKEASRVPVQDAWLGMTFSPKGDILYVGGGSRASVFEFSFFNGTLKPTRAFPVVDANKRTTSDFIGDVSLTPDGHLIYAADLYRDSVVVINPQSGLLIGRVKTGRRPYRILFAPDGQSFYVTSWVDGSVTRYQTSDGQQLGLVRVAAHPTDMVYRAGGPSEKSEGTAGTGYSARIFVPAANTNSVYALGVNDTGDLHILENINLALTPIQPLGITPSAAALSPNGKLLYVVLSDANAVAVVDVSGDRSQVLGYIPAGWYPTAARVLAGGAVVVMNGRGLRSFPNPGGPNPLKDEAAVQSGLKASEKEYVGRLQTGTISLVPPLNEAKLAEYTEAVRQNSPYRDSKLDAKPKLPAGIKHVLYIVKENRTYDQVLGDMKEGNGDPSLTLFGEEVTPNLHKIAREFVLLDNFYVNADVSADGHSWSLAAIAPDYVQKMWPNSYAARRDVYDFEGDEPAALPPAGYLWTNARAAGVSIRNYGHWVKNKSKAAANGIQIEGVKDSALINVTNPEFRSFDLDYPDVARVRVFEKDLAEFERTGEMPQLLLMRLGNDHTSGTDAGHIAPRAAVADNDYAMGLLVQAISHSRFWKDTAIFVVEDDAQDGPDHVDSHRSTAYVISSYVRRKNVDSNMYNTTSMLRTMELLLGMHPMTVFDAASPPMTSVFQEGPEVTPYTAVAPRIPLDTRNPGKTEGTANPRMDFREADRADDAELNEVLWRAIKGTSAPPPARSYFSR